MGEVDRRLLLRGVALMDFKNYHGTLKREYWELMLAPSVRKSYCMVCGKTEPLNQHHCVFRSAGELHDPHGRKLSKPMLTLCGNGNASGCHGAAHEGRLWFRYVNTNLADDFGMKRRYKKPLYGCPQGGHWEYLLLPTGLKEYTNNPNATYSDAIELDGWRTCL